MIFIFSLTMYFCFTPLLQSRQKVYMWNSSQILLVSEFCMGRRFHTIATKFGIRSPGSKMGYVAPIGGMTLGMTVLQNFY